VKFWPALVVTGEEIEAEVASLSSMALPPGTYRRSFIIHPSSVEPGRALAPGIDVAVNILLPGAVTAVAKNSASQVAFCIRGKAVCHVGSSAMAFEERDVWNIPSLNSYSYQNTGSESAVFLSYSNAPLLKKLCVYYVAEESASSQAANRGESSGNEQTMAKPSRELATNAAVGTAGARVLGYEYLVDIDVVPSPALLWRWEEVSQHLDSVEHLGGAAGKGYRGRHLVVLYNPATGRRIGTTPSFFASIAQFPPNRVDVPHRHTSAAINYIFAGDGQSTVDGHRFYWKAGDLMLSAPGWAVHNHSSGNKGCNILTIQDHPLQIAMESLVWQESIKGQTVKLGAERGIQTNIAQSLAGN
jgi:gentisate 1,2-dioxygenase